MATSKRCYDENFSSLDETTLRNKLRVVPAVAYWSKEQWEHQLDSLYLKVKNELDKAACRLIRIKNKSMANELYFRIKANETSLKRHHAYMVRDRTGKRRSHRIIESMPRLAPLLQQPERGKSANHYV